MNNAGSSRSLERSHIFESSQKVESSGTSDETVSCPDVLPIVVDALMERERLGEELAIYDLPQLTGLPLAECFVAVRTLEFEKMARLEDDPADPFGAKLKLLETARERLDTLAEKNTT